SRRAHTRPFPISPPPRPASPARANPLSRLTTSTPVSIFGEILATGTSVTALTHHRAHTEGAFPLGSGFAWPAAPAFFRLRRAAPHVRGPLPSHGTPLASALTHLADTLSRHIGIGPGAIRTAGASDRRHDERAGSGQAARRRPARA